MANLMARRLRTLPTEAEKALWRHLRQKQVADARFRRQHPIDRYVVDFVCLEARLVIEVDGGQHATADESARDAYLRERGYRVLRFWNNEVLGNVAGVLTVIAAALVDPPPHPSPARGEGE